MDTSDALYRFGTCWGFMETSWSSCMAASICSSSVLFRWGSNGNGVALSAIFGLSSVTPSGGL